MKILNDKGFSLIELLIAVFVFSVGILAVASMQLQAVGSNSGSLIISQATSLAEAKAEELMALDFNHADLQDLDGDDNAGLGNGSEGNTPPAFDNNPGTVGDADYMEPSPDGFFSTYWNVRNNWPNANSKTVRIIVRWAGGGTGRTDATVDVVIPQL